MDNAENAKLMYVRLFGPVRVEVKGQAMTLKVNNRKRCVWLLALLSLNANKEMSRESLIMKLWPNTDKASALHYLSSALAELKAVLDTASDRIDIIGNHSLKLNLGKEEVDILQFNSALSSREMDDLQKAVGYYTGPIAQDCKAEWVNEHRLAYRDQYLNSLERLAELLQNDDAPAAIRHLKALIREDPLRESAVRLHMNIIARTGTFAEVDDLYQSLKRRITAYLKSEFGTVGKIDRVLEDATEECYQNLRKQHQIQYSQPNIRALATNTHVPQENSPVQEYSILQALPPQLDTFIGRTKELQDIRSLLSVKRLVTLTGIGGGGKTRLALKVAHDIKSKTANWDFGDGIAWVSLASITDPSLVFSVIATALGLSQTANSTLLQTICAALQPKKMLIVLDKCEHLSSVCTEVYRELFHSCPGIKILCTSRDRLGLQGEQIYSVPMLSIPESETVEGISNSESGQLFVERVRQDNPRFVVTIDNAHAIASICRRLDGIPLALELASAKARVITVGEIEQRLNHRFQLLTNRSGEQTLRKVINSSYELLKPAPQELFRSLSVFRNGWTLQAAEHVCVGHGNDAEVIVDLLISLVDMNLVKADASGEVARYLMLETIQDYAAQQLSQNPLETEYRKRHQQFCLSLAEQAEQESLLGKQEAWLHRMYLEYENMRVALEACNMFDDGPEMRLKLVGALCRFWIEASYFSEGLKWCELALLASEAQGKTVLRAKVLNGIGQLACPLAKYAEAVNYFNESREIFSMYQDWIGEGTAHKGLGVVAHSQGRYVDAHSHLHDALDLYSKANDKKGLADTCNNLGALAIAQNRLNDAEEFFQKSISNYKLLNNLRRIVDVRRNLATLYTHQEDMRALNELKENLDMCKQIGYRHGSSYALRQLGCIFLFRGECENAEGAFTESYQILKEIGDWYAMPLVLADLGNVALAQCDVSRATYYYKQYLERQEEANDQVGIMNAYFNLGDAAYAQHNYRLARKYYAFALGGFLSLEDARGSAAAQNGLGLVALRENLLEEAGDHFRESLLINRDQYRSLGVRRYVAYSLNHFALHAVACGRSFGRETDFQRAAEFWGVESKLREELQIGLLPSEKEERQDDVQFAKGRLEPAKWNMLWERGHLMSIEEAIEHALSGVSG